MTSRQGGDEAGDALAIAIAALSYFASQPKILERFFALTGLEAHTIEQAAATPGFATGVLDFLVTNEDVLIAVAAEQEMAPEAIVAAHARLRSPAADDDWPPSPVDDWA